MRARSGPRFRGSRGRRAPRPPESRSTRARQRRPNRPGSRQGLILAAEPDRGCEPLEQPQRLGLPGGQLSKEPSRRRLREAAPWVFEALLVAGDDRPLLAREGPQRLQRHPPALELDEVSMLGEPARHRRELGPHEGEQLSGVHAGIFNARALTDHTVEAVKTMVSSSDDVSETSGLRIVAEQAEAQMNLRLSVALLPDEDDEVIEEQGARVFLEPEAAALFDDNVLDASVEQNQVAFTITDQVEE